MDDQPSFRPFVFPTLLLLLVGWGGMALLLNFTFPALWPRWGFYALLILGGTGTSLPISYWFNTRFSSKPGLDPRVIVRQSVSVGVYLAVLAWLGIGRVLNLSIAVWLALGVGAIEYLVRSRENSSKPQNVTPRSSGS